MSTLFEFVFRMFFNAGEASNWSIIRVWRDFVVLKRKSDEDQQIVGLCATSRGSPGFNGVGIVYIPEEDADQLLLTDVSKSEIKAKLEEMAVKTAIKKNVPEVQVLSKLNQFVASYQSIAVNVEVIVCVTPLVFAVEALPRKSLCEPSPTPEADNTSKKRKSAPAIDSESTTKTPENAKRTIREPERLIKI